MDYEVNSIKKDPSGSGSFAIKTGFDDDREWKVVSLGDMQHYVLYNDVEHWTDLVEVK
jgi:hypothetical protein